MKELTFYFTKPFNQGDFMVDYVLDDRVIKTEKVEDRYYSLDEVDGALPR